MVENGNDETAEVVAEVELPTLVASVLPTGDIHVEFGAMPFSVDRMYVLAALIVRMANRSLDDAEAQSRRATLEVARDMSDVHRRLQS